MNRNRVAAIGLLIIGSMAGWILHDGVAQGQATTQASGSPACENTFEHQLWVQSDALRLSNRRRYEIVIHPDLRNQRWLLDTWDGRVWSWVVSGAGTPDEFQFWAQDHGGPSPFNLDEIERVRAERRAAKADAP